MLFTVSMQDGDNIITIGQAVYWALVQVKPNCMFRTRDVTHIVTEPHNNKTWTGLQCTVFYDFIEILVSDAGVMLWLLTFSNDKRERGNNLYARNDFMRAITVYEK